jgi:transcriptional regulator with GAF, ATPase, and Fis domain
MSEIDDATSAALQALAYRTPLEDSLLGITTAMSVEANVEALLERILEEARVFTRAEAGAILLVDGDQLKFSIIQNEPMAARYGTRDLRRRFQLLPLPLTQPSLATHVAFTGATLNVDDAHASHVVGPIFNRAIDQFNDYQTRSLLALPLQTPAGTVLGVMELINARRESDVIVPFSAVTEELARAYASLASVAVHRQRLDEATFKDTLTDLYNRRYLGMRVEEESRSSPWTSTTSSASTARPATRAATPCSARSACCYAVTRAGSPWPPATTATTSPSSCPTRRGRAR